MGKVCCGSGRAEGVVMERSLGIVQPAFSLGNRALELLQVEAMLVRGLGGANLPQVGSDEELPMKGGR